MIIADVRPLFAAQHHTERRPVASRQRHRAVDRLRRSSFQVVIAVYPFAGKTPLTLRVANRSIAEVEETIVQEPGLASEVWVWGSPPAKPRSVTIPVEVYSNKRRRSAR